MGLKIGVPKVRSSRKLLLVTLGLTVLLGGTGGAALYMGGRDLLSDASENVAGGACMEARTMVLKTPSNHLWLRRYIRMESTDGPERVRTALRIAGLLAKTHAVDPIHVSVLDSRGPDKRAHMRGRAIGAEVLIALQPQNLPEMKTPAMASYYEGPVSDEGRFYGDKVIIDFEEIRGMMTAMQPVPGKRDCTRPDGSEIESAAADKGPGTAAHGETKPAGAHEEQAGQATGDHPVLEEKSIIDSMLSMVGFGGDDELPAAEKTSPMDATTH